jgi:hypothetical protein
MLPLLVLMRTVMLAQNAGRSRSELASCWRFEKANSHYLNRWTQPDTIVPDLYNPQSLNRYAYVYNSPVRFRDLD